MKFLCLAYEEQAVLEALTTQEWQALRRETLEYVDGLRSRGQLIDAKPLQKATTASTVRVRGGRPSITDGPFAETKEQLGGYFVVDCESLDEAIEAAGKLPTARHGSIEVRPLVER